MLMHERKISHKTLWLEHPIECTVTQDTEKYKTNEFSSEPSQRCAFPVSDFGQFAQRVAKRQQNADKLSATPRIGRVRSICVIAVHPKGTDDMKRTEAQRSALMMRMSRILSGLFLLAFVTSHLLNLSLGVISIEAMDNARPVLTGIWSNPVVGPILLLALIVHFILGLWSIYRRPTLQTNLQDSVQIVTGLLVIPLMATHVVGAASLGINGVNFNYAVATKFFWLDQPQIGLLQVILLSIVWIHGCAGLFTWLRSREDMRSILGWLYPVAVAVPVMALMGYAEAGRGVLIDAQEARTSAPSYSENAPLTATRTPPIIPYKVVKEVTNQIIWWSLGLAALTLAAREVRVRLHPFEHVQLKRGDCAPIATTSKLTVFDSFRIGNQPHAGLCEGRGRCGTCAVRILASEFPLPQPTALEIKTLSRIGADEDTRLACQLTPSGGSLEVEPLYPADYSFKDKDIAETAQPGTQPELQT